MSAFDTGCALILSAGIMIFVTFGFIAITAKLLKK
jgi:hypothetical protein